MKRFNEFVQEAKEVEKPLTLGLNDLSFKVEEMMKKIIKKYEGGEGAADIEYQHKYVVHSHGNVYKYADFIQFRSKLIPREIQDKIQTEVISGIAKITKRKLDPSLYVMGYWELPSMTTKDGYSVRGGQVGGTGGGIGIYFTKSDIAGFYFSQKY